MEAPKWHLEILSPRQQSAQEPKTPTIHGSCRILVPEEMVQSDPECKVVQLVHFALYLYVQSKEQTNPQSCKKERCLVASAHMAVYLKRWCSLWVSPQNHQTRVPSKKRHARHPQGCVFFSQGCAFFARQTCTCGIEPSIASFPQAHGLAVSEVVFFMNHPATQPLNTKTRWSSARFPTIFKAGYYKAVGYMFQ